MNYSEIINERGKYHYLLVVSKKTLLLSNGNDKDEVKSKCIDKLSSKGGKLDKSIIIQLSLEKIKKNKFNIPGRIKVTCKIYQYKKNKLKFMKDDERNVQLFITDSYLKKNREIKSSTIKKIAKATYHGKINPDLFEFITQDDI